MGRISPATWAAMETFLTSIGSGQYNAMAIALVQMGATDTKVDIPKFADDLEKVFTAVQVIIFKYKYEHFNVRIKIRKSNT